MGFYSMKPRKPMSTRRLARLAARIERKKNAKAVIIDRTGKPIVGCSTSDIRNVNVLVFDKVQWDKIEDEAGQHTLLPNIQGSWDDKALLSVEFPHYPRAKVLVILKEDVEQVVHMLYVYGWLYEVPMQVRPFTEELRVPILSARIQLGRDIAEFEQQKKDKPNLRVQTPDYGPASRLEENFILQGKLNAAYRRNNNDTRAFDAATKLVADDVIKSAMEPRV
jgi:hypothetical protein